MSTVSAAAFQKERIAQARKALARAEKALDAFEFGDDPTWESTAKLAKLTEAIIQVSPEEKRGRPPGTVKADKPKRGRPPKAKEPADPNAPKRKRGRPPKAKPPETTPAETVQQDAPMPPQPDNT